MFYPVGPVCSIIWSLLYFKTESNLLHQHLVDENPAHWKFSSEAVKQRDCIDWKCKGSLERLLDMQTQKLLAISAVHAASSGEWAVLGWTLQRLSGRWVVSSVKRDQTCNYPLPIRPHPRYPAPAICTCFEIWLKREYLNLFYDLHLAIG